MSRRRTTLAVIAALGCVQSIDAQQVRHPTPFARETQRLATVLDSLVARHQTAHARRQAYDDSVTQARSAFDTVRSGPITVLATPGERRAAAAAARIAVDTLALLGDTLLARLHGLRFVVRGTGMSTHELSRPRAIWESKPEPRMAITRLDHNDIEQNPFHERASQTALFARYIVDHAQRRLAQSVPVVLATWAGRTGSAAPIQFDTVETFEWTQLRLGLVSSASVVSRRCFEGSMVDCRHVLGLDSSDTPARTYYDAAGRRAVVERNGERFRRREYARTESCLAGADSACVQLLERNVADMSISSTGSRVALFRLAIQQGGMESTGRVFRATGPVGAQLAAISGIPVDSLTALWLDRVRNERVASDNVAPGMTFASLGWIGLLVLLAVRNKRWR
jgi:hypothetical protein